MSYMFYPVACFTLGYVLGMYSKFEYKHTRTYDCKQIHCKCQVEGKCEKTTHITT